MARRRPQRPYDAIVIGTGLGGSVAAAVLASEGVRVLILEKNKRPGGVCSYYEKEGFRIDIGTHMFTRGAKGPFGRIARRVSAPRLRFRQPRDIAYWSGFGVRFAIPRDLHRYPPFLLRVIRELKLSPREIAEATRFFHDILRMDEVEIQRLDTVPLWEFVLGYTRNPHLIGIFGFLLGLYFILPLRQISAGEGIWCFQRMMKDRALSYPVGGSIAVPQAFLEAARRHGAELRLGAEVERILVDEGQVVGVQLADGTTIEALVVVGTTSLRDHVERLVGPEHFPQAYVERVRSLQSSLIAVQAKFALKRPMIRAGALVGSYSETLTFDDITIETFDRIFEDVVNGRVPEAVPLYGPVPTNFDPSLAPKGRQLLTVCAVAPTTDLPWSDPPKVWIERMLEAVYGIVPGLEREVIFVDTMDVRFIERWMGKSGGAAVTTGQTPDQTGIRRPPVRTPIRGLYVCGDNAGGRGVGTELAAASGEEAADAVVQDLHNGLVERRRQPRRIRAVT